MWGVLRFSFEFMNDESRWLFLPCLVPIVSSTTGITGSTHGKDGVFHACSGSRFGVTWGGGKEKDE